jgi:hypothetical protein
MNSIEKTSWGYRYNGINISGKGRGKWFRVRYNFDNANGFYYFSRLADAKNFIDNNHSSEWVALQNK